MIAAILIFLITLIGKLAYDEHLYKSGKRNQHLRGAIIVFIALVVCSWAAGWLSAGIWFMGWWILFNGLYAVLIGQKWGYLGTTAYLDIWESKHRWVTPVKYLVFFTSLILYLLL